MRKARLSEPGSPRRALGWRGLAAGCVAFGIAVLVAIWAPIAAYGRHLQEQSAASLAHGTAAKFMPGMLTKVPAVRECLSIIVPFFRDAASHEWVRQPCRVCIIGHKPTTQQSQAMCQRRSAWASVPQAMRVPHALSV